MLDMVSETPRFTEPQKKAIETRGKTLLVSAGAGSGKTTVLTERIIQRITDKNDPCNITDFLVVTFTKASANDLKRKISRAINKILSDDFGNIHLKYQQLMLGRANISTIHSFYHELVRSNFEKLGLPAKFRLADDNEISVIRRKVFDNLLEEYYSSESEIYKTADFSCQDFIMAIENFISSRDDANIYKVIWKIYQKISSLTNRLGIFENQIEMMAEIENINDCGDNFFGLKIGKVFRQMFCEKISVCMTELAKLLEFSESDVKFSKKYTPSFSSKYGFLRNLNNFIDSGCSYKIVYNLCQNYSKVSIGRHKIGDEKLQSFLRERNDKISKKIDEIIKYFEYDFEDIRRFAKSYKSIIKIIYDFLKRFEDAVLAEKIRLKSFEFSDLEQFAFKLLIEKVSDDGTICETETARQLKSRFKEIYIDEYQDTNRLQDTIFRAISTENVFDYSYGNRFMVGDIKQSIYAFRGAKSDIFSFYSKLFSEDTHKIQPQKIYLKDNFRSSYNIISFINCIFEELFSEKLGGVEYTGGEVLSCGKIFIGDEDDKKSTDTMFAIIEKRKDESNESDENSEESGESGDDNSNAEYDIESAEAEYVALTVKNLIANGKLKNGEKISPRDITILMRSMTESKAFMDALKRHGIPNYTDKAKGFLESAEIMLMVSLLKTIDNPHSDISLAAVLKSPVFSFTLDDLIYLKNFHEVEKTNKKEYLYYYVKSYAETEDNDNDSENDLRKRCRNFLEKLRLWRLKSRTMTIDKFVWYLYRQTDIFAKTAGSSYSDERRGNLLLLHEYARQFEITAFSGLYGFLNYIDDVKSGQDDFEKAKILSENSDVVRIMSIHKSKGLEFPVCILACTGKKFNVNDYTNDPIVSGDFGIYFNLKCEDGMGYEKTTFKKAAAEKIKAEMMSEEARILYVALTRAVEKLIVVGSVDNIGSFLAKYTADDGIEEDKFKRAVLFSEANCPLKWLAPIILNSNGKNRTNVSINVDLVDRETLDNMIIGVNDDDNNNMANTQVDVEKQGSEVDTLSESELSEAAEYEGRIREMYDYRYPQKFLSKIPAKLSVSTLHPGILDNDEYVRKTDEFTLIPAPKFLDETNDGINAGDNPALTGIAMHLFMQFADFDNAEKAGSASEAANLASRGFINDTQFSRLNFSRLDKFFKSGLYKKIKAARNIYREMRFNMKVPVSDFSEDEDIKKSGEYMLIQGVIDLFFIDRDGQAVVVDFKTDYVKRDEGEKILIERHFQQLKYYCTAVGKILNKEAKTAYIYSFALGKEIDVKIP